MPPSPLRAKLAASTFPSPARSSGKPRLERGQPRGPDHQQARAPRPGERQVRQPGERDRCADRGRKRRQPRLRNLHHGPDDARRGDGRHRDHPRPGLVRRRGAREARRTRDGAVRGRIMPRKVTAFSNTTVKRLRSLRDKKARRAEGLFLAEGLRILTEARDSGRLPEIVAFSAEGAKHPLAAQIIAATEAAGGDAIETSADILAKMSGKDNPQMLLGAYRQPDTSLELIERSNAPLWIVAQALRDPGNIGTILRTGDAVGAGGLILIDDSADPFSVEAVRASMGAVFTQDVASARWPEFVAWLRSGDGQLVGTSLKATQDYLEAEYREPCFLLIGNEQQGLPADYEAECDLLVKIPMAGRADSLNAAMATAVMAFSIKSSWR